MPCDVNSLAVKNGGLWTYQNRLSALLLLRQLRLMQAPVGVDLPLFAGGLQLLAGFLGGRLTQGLLLLRKLHQPDVSVL